MALIASIVAGIIVKTVSPVVDKQIKDKQSHVIKKHNNLGFVKGAKVQAWRGPQKNRIGIVEEVKHLWLILEDADGDRYRLLVGNCVVLDSPPAE